MKVSYFNCGMFLSEDESAAAFFVILDEIESELVPTEIDGWRQTFITPLQEKLREQAHLDEESKSEDGHQESRMIKLNPEMVATLIPPLQRYYDRLYRKLGDRDPYEIRSSDLFETADTNEVNRLWCAAELLYGCRRSEQIGQPVNILFD